MPHANGDPGCAVPGTECSELNAELMIGSRLTRDCRDMVNARICPIGKPQGCVTRVVRDAGQPGCAKSDAFDEAAQGGGCRDTVGGHHSDRLLARIIVHDCEQSITRTHQFRDVEKRSVRADRHSVDVRLESGQLTNTIRGAAQATLAGNGGWSRAIESAVRTDKMRVTAGLGYRRGITQGSHWRIADAPACLIATNNRVGKAG